MIDSSRGFYCLGIDSLGEHLRQQSQNDELFFVYSIAGESQSSDIVEAGYWLNANGAFMRHFQKDADLDFNTFLREDALFNNVKGLDFKYFDNTAWIDSWDSRKNGKLPRAVKIEIVLGAEQGLPEQKFSTTVYVPTAK